MPSLLDDVNELIKQNRGDFGRLNHIKEILEKNNHLYVSDRQYLTELSKKYLEKIPEMTKSDRERLGYSSKSDDILDSENENMQTKENIKTKENNFEIIQNKVSQTSFCGNCGNAITHGNFCPKCGSSLNYPQSEKPVSTTNRTVEHSGIRSFQVLSIIGGVLGLLVSLAYVLTASVFETLSTSFGGSGFDSDFSAYYSVAMPLVLIIYISCFIVPFVIKKTKIVGMYLITSSFVVIVASSYVGLLGFALLLPAGILALRQKH